MAVLYIRGEIGDKTVDIFLGELNKIKQSENVTIYLNSEGGYTSDAQTIIDIINATAKRFTLVACGEIYSSAFNIFFEVKCKRRILDETVGMAHFSWSTFELNEAGEPITDEDRFLMNEMKSNKASTIQRFRELGLNSREIGKLKANKEVYFTTTRLKELLDAKAS